MLCYDGFAEFTPLAGGFQGLISIGPTSSKDSISIGPTGNDICGSIIEQKWNKNGTKMEKLPADFAK